jgi:hypothetical protein
LTDDEPTPAHAREESLTDRSRRLQKAYEADRRAWGQAVGRPYDGDPDLRPPPGELDADADD